MLIKVFCDKFVEEEKVRNPVSFFNDLNVILGDNAGSNSIGKSTFLLILDFVFGGDSYVEKAIDVQKNVGRHTIKFTFKFNGDYYYFSRDSVNNQSVSVCDEHHVEQSQKSISEYRNFLKEKYKIVQNDLSFRDAISRYFRIYQKENLNEKYPLQGAKGEPEKKAILSLLKLFDLYSGIQSLREAYEDAANKDQIYRKAVDCDFIPSIKTQRELKEKETRLVTLLAQQNSYTDPEVLKNKSAEELVRISNLKRKLQQLRTLRSRLETKIARLDINLSEGPVDFCEDFRELKELFPSINLEKISEVEAFHCKLTSIFKDELIDEKSRLQEEFNSICSEITQEETELSSFDVPSGISKRMLNDFASAAREIKNIEVQQENYLASKGLQDTCKTYKKQYVDRLQADLVELQASITRKMKELNDFIYEGEKKAPFLILKENSYQFITPDDTGTGTSYKSLVVFDLSILALTNLPALIHDSVILKNIGDAPIEKILDLYQHTGKQIFIALDKSDSYSAHARKILEESAVLKLSINGHELFGWSWSDNTTNGDIGVKL